MAFNYETAKYLDMQDPVAYMRSRFYLNENELYMDGNSLGLMSKDAEASLSKTLDDWRTLGIRGWIEADQSWFYMSEKLAALQAPLVGAKENELTIHSSTTLNLHLLLASFYRPRGKRKKILVDALNFPTDIYAVRSHLEHCGVDSDANLIIVQSNDGLTLDENELVAHMDETVALVLLPGVLYRSGQCLDMERLVKAAHDVGAMIGLDLSHSAGAVMHKLHEWGTDFAFWCNYKYFNGGPGAAASLFVHERHLKDGPALSGWFGYRKDKQFALALDFEPSETASAWEIGTPHVMSMATLFGSLSQFGGVGMKALREKSVKLTEALIELIETRLAQYGFSVGTPREFKRRGGHVALVHPEAARINEAMKTAGIIPDYREPNIIRLAPVPLYTRFVDIIDLVNRIEKIMQTEAYKKYENKRGTVA